MGSRLHDNYDVDVDRFASPGLYVSLPELWTFCIQLSMHFRSRERKFQTENVRP